MAAERARAEAAEREQEVLKQKEAEQQQKLEDQDCSYQENLQQLEEKLEDERKKLLEEQGKMLDQKLKEQEALLREGFREEAGCLESEIRRLQQQTRRSGSRHGSSRRWGRWATWPPSCYPATLARLPGSSPASSGACS
ncbi:unnamed protein product, partial [Natator depressus]